MKYILTLTALLITQSLHAVTVNLSATKDNTLIETNAQALSNGAGEYFFIGRTNQGTNELRRGLIYFDISSIPTGSTINAVSLNITSSRTIAGQRDVSIHTAQADWGESTSNSTALGGGMGAPAETGDATWTNAFHNGAAWSTAGGDFNPSAIETLSINGDQTISFVSNNLVTEVQSWLDVPAGNFGLFVIGDESTSTTAYRFNSRENNSNPPELIIDYSLPQMTFLPSKDNTLFETVDGSVSNGSGDKIFIGKPNNGLLRRGVLEFDITSLPMHAVITSVSLDLNVIDIPANAQNGTAALHLALSEWGEAGSSGNGQGAPSQTGDATWIHTFFSTDLWTTAGGDFMPAASSTADFTDQTTSITFASTANMVADVTTWFEDPSDNHGWIILGDETNNGNSRSFASLDNATAANRPTLTIEYFVPEDLIFANGFE